jgi:hypothetical protein
MLASPLTEMAPSTALKSTKEKSGLPLQKADEDAKFTPQGRPVRKNAGKRHNDGTFVNSTDAIVDKFADFVDQKSEEVNRSKSKYMKEFFQKRIKRGRSPSPPPYNPVHVPTEASLTAMEYAATPIVERSNQFEPINITVNIPLGYSGPVKIHLDSETIAKLAIPSPYQHHLTPNPHKRKRLHESARQADVTPVQSLRIRRYVKKHGQEPAGFCDLPPG